MWPLWGVADHRLRTTYLGRANSMSFPNSHWHCLVVGCLAVESISEPLYPAEREMAALLQLAKVRVLPLLLL